MTSRIAASLRLLASTVAVVAAPALARGDTPSQPEAARPAITVSEVAPATLRDRVLASGLVAAVEEVQVQPLVAGQPIEALLADVGDRVEAGERRWPSSWCSCS